jgi:hypothetical protein
MMQKAQFITKNLSDCLVICKNLKFVIICVFCIICVQSFSQEYTPEIIQNIIEQIAENSEDEIDFSILQDNLELYFRSPLNLNRATREDLEQLYILSDFQIENLLFYLYRFAPMFTIYELRLIEGFDQKTIENLLPFITVEPPKETKKNFNLPNLLKRGKHNIFLQSRYTFENREGYSKEPTDNSNKRYLGEPFYLMLKYNFRSSKLVFGFTAEKDEGEPFLNKRAKGFDFYSAHFQINDVGVFKRIIVGDYRAGFGFGLLVNNNFNNGKSSYVLNVLPSSTGLNRTASANENNFFRGVAATAGLGKFSISGFYSYKNIGGTPSGENSFSAFKTDGLHRIPTEIERRKNIEQQVLGTNISFSHIRYRVGMTFLHTQFNHSYEPNPAPYNLFYFRGKEQTGLSIDYRYSRRRIRFYGETAMNLNAGKSIATLNGMIINPISRVSFIVLQRYYSKSYNALFASSFAESSQINNEQGIYIGTEILPWKSWKISAYIDSFSFPWLKFGIDRPSSGNDFLVQLDYIYNENLDMYLRYKHKQKEKNISSIENVTNVVGNNNKTTLKYVLNYRANDFVRFRNTIEWNATKTFGSEKTNGFMIAQDISFGLNKIPLKIDLRYVIFDAETYDNRLYAYEKDILHAFSVPMYDSKGNRIYLNMSYAVSDNLSFWFKISHTKYFDKTTVGSNLEVIDGNHKTDMRLMLRGMF